MLFEFHRQVVLYKDAEPKVTKKIFVIWAPYNLWRNISRAYKRRWLFSPAPQARLVPASAGDKEETIVWICIGNFGYM